MPWPDVVDLLTYWSQFPPPHESLAILARTANPRRSRATTARTPSSREEVEAFNRLMDRM